MFRKKSEIAQNSSDRLTEFSYLKNNDIYVDSACQSLRPQPVIDAMNEYYQTYNACGDRVKYEWGKKVDAQVEDTRDLVINYLGLSPKNYICSFTLNTTYGINLILSQLPTNVYKQIITSDIEHNSVFLSTISLAARLSIDRTVLSRHDDGSLDYNYSNLDKPIVVVSATSNIDGRLLLNINELIKDVHNAGGIIIIDAAQTMAHYHELLVNCNADAICFSAHKMYAASLGVIVIKKELLKSLDISVVGGGMAISVKEQSYILAPDNMACWLEPGLQAYAEIISLKSAINWLKTVKPFGLKPNKYIAKISDVLYKNLSEIPGIIMVSKKPSTVISFYSEKIDAHRLSTFLSTYGIMARSGSFCCHYYLLEKVNLPPLLRFSIGLNTTENDITKIIEVMKKITKG
jgi:cysteine desulfurase/selenocysteine lyase